MANHCDVGTGKKEPPKQFKVIHRKIKISRYCCSRHIAALVLAYPARVPLPGLTPHEYLAEVIAIIERRLSTWQLAYGPLDSEGRHTSGNRPTWYDTADWLLSDMSPTARQKVAAARTRHHERYAARQAHKQTPLVDRLAAFRAATKWGVKFPRTSWSATKFHFATAPKAIAHVERNFRPGYTSEPYVQLCNRNPAGTTRVVAEYSRGQWLDPLVAAGFMSHAVPSPGIDIQRRVASAS